MPSPGYMYHPADGKKLFDDLTPAYQSELEKAGWRDSPDKISPVPESGDMRYEDPSSRKLGTSDTNERPARDIRNVGIDDFLAGGEILSSAAALGRMSKLVDAGGQNISGNLSYIEFYDTVWQMSLDEVHAVAAQVGASAAVAPSGEYDSVAVRGRLMEALRPGAYEKELDARVAARIGTIDNQNVGNGDGLESANRNAEIIDPPLSSDGTQARTAPVDGEDQPADVHDQQVNAKGPSWLTDSDLTKDRLASWLDKHGVSYKARDSKDALIELVRANADKAAE